MKSINYLLFLALFGLAATCENQTGLNQATVAFYNVENLFDTINDPSTHDEEFTPKGRKNWNSKRYRSKLKKLAKVIHSINDAPPALVGLAEIENKTVLNDLINSDLLKNSNYRIVQEDSPDARGIDVALLYNTDLFKHISHEAIRIKLDENPNYKTRDILYVKGKLSDEIVHIFVNHWSSRRGGKEKSQSKRVNAARILRARVDAILAAESNAKIIIIGDFNDEPQDVSIAETLHAKGAKELKTNKLCNLMYSKIGTNTGSYSYKSQWDMIDNIIVSEAFVQADKGWHIGCESGYIFKPDWLLFTNPKTGTKTPNRTYGRNYYGGYSDHLPVYTILHLK